jgi:two-component system nitrate/nitrite response regulator NarL
VTVEVISSAANTSSQTCEEADRNKAIIPTAVISGSFLIRSGFRQVIQGTHFGIVEEGSDLAPEWLGHGASLFVIDANQPTIQVLEAVQKIRQRCPTSRIVALADQFDLGLLHTGFEAGVDSFCLGTSAPEVLINVLELTMLGEKVLPGTVLRSLISQATTDSTTRQISSKFDQREPDPTVKKLSPRETVILQSLMGGDANKVIARKLDITEATIKVHVKAILRKIGAANRTQAAMWANENLRPANQMFPSS